MECTEQNHSQQINELFSALAKAQGRIETALKDKKNPFFKSSYADLSSIWEVCRDPLSSNGLSVIQTVEGTKSDMFLVTWLGHSSGQWIKSRLPLLIAKQDPQGVGSAITYARRYALSALVGVCQEDDDGEKAMDRKAKKLELVEKESEEQTNSIIKEFSKHYPEEDAPLIKEFLDKYSKHWNKSVKETITRFSDMDEFLKVFNPWKEKQSKAA